MSGIPATDWINGSLPPREIVSLDRLKPLTGMAQGNPLWKSNNPEVFTSDGWLMQTARDDRRMRTGAVSLSGTFGIYLFHINKSSQTRFIHILATNLQPNIVQISGKGSMLSNREFPLGETGTGLNYRVARNWLEGKHRVEFGAINLAPNRFHSIDRLTLDTRNMVDGRFELTTSAPVLVSAVVTSTGSLNDAISAAQGSPASGEIASPDANRFGREAGICRHSEWKGTTEIEVPAARSYLGLCLNTSNKFNSTLQDQTSDYLMRLSDSADRSYGNYGHKYDITLALKNSSSSQRQVRLWFGSNVKKTEDKPSFTYNGPIKVNDTIKDVYIKPTDPKDELGTVTIGANSSSNIRLQFYVPGLITIGQQLILESV